MTGNETPVVEARVIGLDELRKRCVEMIALIDEIETKLHTQCEALEESMESLHIEKTTI